MCASTVIDGLGAAVVWAGDPGQLGGAVLRALGLTADDQRLGEPFSADVRGDVEVVHHRGPGGARRRPGEQQRREPDGFAGPVAGQQLQSLASAGGEQAEHQRAQVAIGRRDRVEVAVGAHQHEQLVEVGLTDGVDRECHLRRHHRVASGPGRLTIAAVASASAAPIANSVG